MMPAEQLNATRPLAALLENFAEVDTDIRISGVAIDSRQVKPGDLFLAYRGTSGSGVDFIDAAIQAGAVAVAFDSELTLQDETMSVPLFRVPNLRQQAGVIASRFFNEPSKDINVIGVTGTNGKTTVSYLISHALTQCDQQAAFIGTLGYGKTSEIQDGSMTTPDPVALQTLFASWRDELDTVVMEVSSHALDQARVSGVAFDVGVYTNLSRDHLDYHETLESYAAAKARLFQTPDLKYAVINADDEFGRELIANCKSNLELIVYTTRSDEIDLESEATIRLVRASADNSSGLGRTIQVQSPWGDPQISSELLGDFNVSNVLAAYAVLCVLGIEANTAAAAVSRFRGVPGRMECFAATNKPLLVVDYAHTPDALEKTLASLRPYCKGKLYCVFGCGGDRDTGKRPQMGAIAEALADTVVLTNDNPRSEKPEHIVTQILAGMEDKQRVIVRYDRSDAITNTYLRAKPEDVVLVAGKGHETTQQIGTEILPFSDRELARRIAEQSS